MAIRRRLLFVYYHEYPEVWKDGLWAAMQILRDNLFLVEFMNLFNNEMPLEDEYDVVLAWGAFGSPADNFVQTLGERFDSAKKGLLIAGNAVEPRGLDTYDLFFCETRWYLDDFVKYTDNPLVFKAFGINSDIFYPRHLGKDNIWDYLSVGAFALWKRHDLIINKPGDRLVVGEVQRGNMSESLDIMSQLIIEGVAVSDMVAPEKLSLLYNLSENVYIPANVVGGGERAVWEARLCGANVIIEEDNPKLKELLESDVKDHREYAKQINNGIKHAIVKK